jgi:hypothetical protein
MTAAGSRLPAAGFLASVAGVSSDVTTFVFWSAPD